MNRCLFTNRYCGFRRRKPGICTKRCVWERDNPVLSQMVPVVRQRPWSIVFKTEKPASESWTSASLNLSAFLYRFGFEGCISVATGDTHSMAHIFEGIILAECVEALAQPGALP